MDSSKNKDEMSTPREKMKQTTAILSKSADTPKDSQLWRDLTAYWILGLCNNYGYVVMLSAAHDIIKKFDSGETDIPNAETNERKCNIVSTGAILLADILPALMIKLSAPFIPFWVHYRVFVAIGAAASGFVLVAFATSQWMALFGVVCTSFSSGLGETTFLSYSSLFNKNVVSTWSSGTGGAGVIGSLSYAGLISLKFTPKDTMLIMLAFPVIEAIAFWVILRHQRASKVEELSDSSVTSSTDLEKNEYVYDDDEKPLLSIKEKLIYISQLGKYMIPLTTVYLFEYLINQGMFELVYFKDIWLDKDSQYRWLQVDYQIGVFVSRSSVNLFTVDKIWIMSVLQLINVIYFTVEVILYVTPNVWIVFAVVFWEGLLGGGAYVNTFYRMSKEIKPGRKQFALGAVTLSDSVGIALAGFLSMPVHNAICKLPLPVRGYVF